MLVGLAEYGKGASIAEFNACVYIYTYIYIYTCIYRYILYILIYNTPSDTIIHLDFCMEQTEIDNATFA